MKDKEQYIAPATWVIDVALSGTLLVVSNEGWEYEGL